MVWALPNIDNIEIYRVRTWQVALGGDGKMKDFVLGLALLPMVHSVLAKTRSVCVCVQNPCTLYTHNREGDCGEHCTHTRKEVVVNSTHFIHTLGRRSW